MNNSNTTATNKEFIRMLLSNRLPLVNYKERVLPDFMLYEPMQLPFGGKYVGFSEYEKLADQIAEYYDFERFAFKEVFAESHVVFALLEVGVKNSDKMISLCEQFIFEGNLIKEIRVFIFD